MLLLNYHFIVVSVMSAAQSHRVLKLPIPSHGSRVKINLWKAKSIQSIDRGANKVCEGFDVWITMTVEKLRHR